VIQLKEFIVSRWKGAGYGEFHLMRETITAVSAEEAMCICDIRNLNEVIQSVG